MLKKYSLFICILILGWAATGCASQPKFAAEPLLPTEREFGGESSGVVSESKATISQAADENLSQAISDDRIVIKNASLSIAVAEPAQTLESISKMAEDMGGFVVSSSLYFTQLESGTEVPQANITIRVPADRLNEAIDQIESGAGRTLSKNITGEDVTREYTDLNSRLRNLQQAEEQLTVIMDSAEKTEDVLAVYQELTSIREQIEVIKGQIQYYDQSAAFSAIQVDILADEAVQPLTIGGWEPGGVVKDALQSLINTLKLIANGLIWFVLWVLPIGLIFYFLIGLVWKGFKALRGRRKGKQPPTQEKA